MITQTDNQKYTRPVSEPMTPPNPKEVYSEQKVQRDMLSGT